MKSNFLLTIMTLGLASFSGQCQKSFRVFRPCALKASRVHLRAGPDLDQDIIWIYILKTKYWPVIILQSKNHWYEISDPQGYRGWVNGAMLTFRPFLWVKNSQTKLCKSPGSTPIAFLNQGVIVSLLKRKNGFSYVSILQNGLRGWISNKDLWPENISLETLK